MSIDDAHKTGNKRDFLTFNNSASKQKRPKKETSGDDFRINLKGKALCTDNLTLDSWITRQNKDQNTFTNGVIIRQ